MKLEIALSAWTPVHSTICRIDQDGRVVINEDNRSDWHLLRLKDARLSGKRLKVVITYKGAPTCDTDLAFFHMGSMTVGRLSRTGEVLDQGLSEKIEVSTRPDGFVTATLWFWNADEYLSFGPVDGPHGWFRGRGRDQFIIESVDVEVVEAEAIDETDRIVVVDVGARHGFSEAWKRQGARVLPVMFEPDPDGAADLLADASAYPGAMVKQVALFNTNGPRTLYITRNAGCSSLLPPNLEFVKPHRIATNFIVERELEVECMRYNTLYARGEVPAPDVVKIDVQGAEYFVLEGFGDLLHNVLGVELECHAYPLYHGEPLITDITTLLAPYGLMLHRLERVSHFDNEWVEFNAWFMRPPRLLADRDEKIREKAAIVAKAWRL